MANGAPEPERTARALSWQGSQGVSSVSASPTHAFRLASGDPCLDAATGACAEFDDFIAAVDEADAQFARWNDRATNEAKQADRLAWSNTLSRRAADQISNAIVDGREALPIQVDLDTWLPAAEEVLDGLHGVEAEFLIPSVHRALDGDTSPQDEPSTLDTSVTATFPPPGDN